MSSPLTSWPRSRFEPGGGSAWVLYVIYGQFTEDMAISGKTYRTAGVPEGVDLRKVTRGQQPELPFTNAEFASTAGKENPELFERLMSVPECLVLQGEMADPRDLNYLRDAVGIVTCLLDHGGIGVMDPQQLKLYDPATWRNEMFEPQPPQLSKHVVILWSDEPDGTKWFHTRGLRKFGRPDLSMRSVSPEHEAAVIEMFNRFIGLQTEGGHIPEGQEIRMASLPPGLTCHHGGSLDDPDFNNVHVEIRPKNRP
jgi:hypothetical protein